MSISWTREHDRVIAKRCEGMRNIRPAPRGRDYDQPKEQWSELLGNTERGEVWVARYDQYMKSRCY